MNNDNEHKEGQEKISKEKSLNTSVNYRQVFDDISSKHTSKRRITNKVVSVVAIVFVIGAIIPLGSILLEVIKNGIAVISIQFLTQPPGSIGSGERWYRPSHSGNVNYRWVSIVNWSSYWNTFWNLSIRICSCRVVQRAEEKEQLVSLPILLDYSMMF